jgi:lipopolysaccharide assembly outer membrane protein LptD (OstA)
MEGSSMKRALLLFLLASLVTPAVAQNGRDFEVGRRVSFEALSQQREGSLLRCRGDVEMATHSFVLRADEVDYHSDTGIAEARGNVRIQLLPVTPNTAPDRRQQHQ